MSKVLFIEDDPSWQEIFAEMLETAGHEAHRATSFNIAIELLGSKKKFEVIVFDLHLGTRAIGENPFTWLDAFILGLDSRKMSIPPIIIVTGVQMSPNQVKQIFTSYRSIVYDFFSKSDFDSQDFMQSLKNAVNFAPGKVTKPRSLWTVIGYTVLMAIIVALTIGVLLWSVNQIADPKTQQTFLQIGGALIVAFALFVLIFSQNTKIEDVIGSMTKIWRG